MKKEVDFSRGRRGAVESTRGKMRITIYLDDDIIRRFKALSEQTGKGYQTLINEALAAHGSETPKTVTAAQVRQIVREELARGQHSEAADVSKVSRLLLAQKPRHFRHR